MQERDNHVIHHRLLSISDVSAALAVLADSLSLP
jgi:hypothetical protein